MTTTCTDIASTAQLHMDHCHAHMPHACHLSQHTSCMLTQGDMMQMLESLSLQVAVDDSLAHALPWSWSLQGATDAPYAPALLLSHLT